MRFLSLVYGLAVYLLFFMTFLYAIGFVGDVVVPRAIDSGPSAPLITALAIDVLLLGVFAVQHSVMARPAFKKVWTRIVPLPIERSTYVLLASLALDLLFWQWRALPQTVWRTPDGVATDLVWAACAAGWLTVLSSTFMINHFDLFGLKQVWEYRRRGESPPPEFRTPLFYRLVRHPIYLGFLVAFWAAPVMSLGRLAFAAITTVYVLIAIQFEEHDLIELFGERYRDYRKRVSMLLPFPR
jgi:protein-S-isoprenylcysteine O-methyltransferase Ste14